MNVNCDVNLKIIKALIQYCATDLPGKKRIFIANIIGQHKTLENIVMHNRVSVTIAQNTKVFHRILRKIHENIYMKTCL